MQIVEHIYRLKLDTLMRWAENVSSQLNLACETSASYRMDVHAGKQLQPFLITSMSSRRPSANFLAANLIMDRCRHSIFAAPQIGVFEKSICEIQRFGHVSCTFRIKYIIHFIHIINLRGIVNLTHPHSFSVKFAKHSSSQLCCV